jgi:hypothetical protein
MDEPFTSPRKFELTTSKTHPSMEQPFAGTAGITDFVMVSEFCLPISHLGFKHLP